MNWWQPHNFDQKRVYLECRTKVIKALRGFFDDREFTEVQTPILQVCPVMDAHIHAFSTVLDGVGKNDSRGLYLHTSPEFDMKKLLAAGVGDIYQICSAFRNAEGSKLHSSEFTILEWYRVGADYQFLMDDCGEILSSVSVVSGRNVFEFNGKSCDVTKVPRRISVCEAFEEYANLDLSAVLDDRDIFAGLAQGIGVRVCEEDRWDDIFHAVMAEKIEPYLGVGQADILYDYPLSMAALSRRKPEDERFAERFELYVCGVELANGFSELTDADEQRKRYEDEMALKSSLYGEVYPPDEEFFKALEFMPECAGIALGVDRLVMLASRANDIARVQWAKVPKLD